MNRAAQTATRASTMVLAVCVGVVVAQDYGIDWYTIDGGGEMQSTGGDYELSGTIGQPDASMTVSTGGDLELTGGFWPGAIPGPTPIPGDCDGDGDVDLDDFVDFEACLLGPGGGIPNPDCVCFDLDGSGAVDLKDFAEFQASFMG